MELRHLRYFVAVAEERHFGRAAERLHIVQPTLSMQIQSLERELGGPLFTRTSRRVELTEAGRVMLVEARRALAQADRAMNTVRQSIQGETGTVRVGFAGIAVLAGGFIRDLAAFREQCPDVHVRIDEMSPVHQVEAILAGELDVGYSLREPTQTSDGLRSTVVATTSLAVAFTADHPFASRPSIELAELGGVPLILYAIESAHDRPLALIRAAIGREPDVAHRVQSTLSVLALAAAGLGVAIVPAKADRVAIPDLVFRPLAAPGISVDIVVVSRIRETSGAVQAFVSNFVSADSVQEEVGPER